MVENNKIKFLTRRLANKTPEIGLLLVQSFAINNVFGEL